METANTKGHPWKRQRILKLTTTIPQQEVINIALSFDDDQERALFVLAYLTAGRISELVQCRYLRKNEYARKNKKVARRESGSPIIKDVKKVEINYPGVRKQDITKQTLNGKEVLIVSIQNRKNKHYIRKSLPIPIHRERPLVDLLYTYIDKLDLPQPLFPFKTWKARNIIAKIDMNPHFIRDIRLTHMVTIYDFNAFELTKFAGWKDVTPAERYIRMGVSDLVNKY